LKPRPVTLGRALSPSVTNPLEQLRVPYSHLYAQDSCEEQSSQDEPKDQCHAHKCVQVVHDLLAHVRVHALYVSSDADQ